MNGNAIPFNNTSVNTNMTRTGYGNDCNMGYAEWEGVEGSVLKDSIECEEREGGESILMEESSERAVDETSMSINHYTQWMAPDTQAGTRDVGWIRKGSVCM
jgi:hypothetical protein